MDYPLIIDGAERGRLRVTREGLYTVYESELKNVGEGLIRIWLHGGGEQAYLGLMQPWSGGMYLRKKLSGLEQQGFPKSIEFASDRNEDGLHNVKTKELPEQLPEEYAEPVETAPSCPWPAPVGEGADALQWFSRPDGSLVSFDGVSSLVALPVSLRRAAPGAVLRRIGEREYMIFRY